MTNTTLHAHVSTNSADCDGRYSSDYITRCDARFTGDFADLDFKHHVVTMLISVYSEYGKLEFVPNGFNWSEPTEEGYSSAEARWCEDECDDSALFRDHSAEAAGY